ncbi:MAG TPA: four helix bundle protein [Verrucomicrobiae bacterium]|nr:four helix bundle protein [Verrucomicrobiae bacterium]
MRDHKDLEVWQAAVGLVTEIYAVTRSFPQEEIYGLTNQIRRSAVSIPSNIAEGAARRSDKELLNFLYIAAGSVSELETQIIIARNLNYLNDPEGLLSSVSSVKKMLYGLIRHYREKNQK